jgi:hypothetical protein
MKKALLIFAFICAFPSILRAQEGDWTIAYTVQSIANDGTTLTVNLSVTLTYSGADTPHTISVRLLSATGGDTEVQGAINFDPITGGQSATSAGAFSAAIPFLNETMLDALLWEVTYVNGAGAPQTEFIKGLKQ